MNSILAGFEERQLQARGRHLVERPELFARLEVSAGTSLDVKSTGQTGPCAGKLS